MKIKYLVITAVLVTVFLGFGFNAQAQTDVSIMIAQLQAQIASLMAQIQTLQSQQGTASWCYIFNANMGVGYGGGDLNSASSQKANDVRNLRTALINNGISEANNLLNGNSMSGSITFDESYASAVVAFQQKYGITPLSGYVGPKTRAKLNSLYGCGTNPNPTPTPIPTPTPVSRLTTNEILNSNGFVNGQKPLQGMTGGETLSNIVIGNDSDGTPEATAVDTWCSASCGEGLVAFKLLSNNVLMVKLPGSGVSGAAQKISSIQINNGIISDAETDFSGTRTNYYTVSSVNGVLQATKVSSTGLLVLPVSNNASSNSSYDYEVSLASGGVFDTLVFRAGCNDNEVSISAKGGMLCNENGSVSFTRATSYSYPISYTSKDGNVHTVDLTVTAYLNGAVVGTNTSSTNVGPISYMPPTINSAESPANTENQFNPGDTVTLYGYFPAASTIIELDRVGTVEHYFASATRDAAGHLIFTAPNMPSDTYSIYLINSPNGGSKISNAIQVMVLSSVRQ